MATRKASRNKRMSGGAKKTRKMPKWAQLVKKVHSELKRKNKGASLGDAMKEASRRRKRGNM
jgi:hypothetical protein